VKPASDIALLRRALPYLRPHARVFALALLAAPASALLTIAQPFLLKLAIDEGIVPGDLDRLSQLTVAYLGAVGVAYVMELTYSIAMSHASLRTITDLRRVIVQHTLSRSQAFFDRQPVGRLLTRATGDLEALGDTLTEGAITVVLDALLVVGILIAMFVLHPGLTMVMLAVAPALILVLEALRRGLRRLYHEVRESLSELNAYVAERLTGVRIVQLYSDEARTLVELDERLGRYRRATVRTNTRDAMLYAVVDGISSVCVALMLWYGAGEVVRGAVSAGLLVAFIDYLGKLFRPIQEFSQKVAIVQRASASLEKIFDLLDDTTAISSGAAVASPLGGALRLENLRFAYGDGPEVLRGVDLVIEPGQVVAVVGRTGSGKSTLGRLLTRSYAPYSGSIRLGAVELADIPPSQLREHVGLVHQDVHLFPDTVRFNIALGAEISDERLYDALSAVDAVDVVAGLGGLDAHLASDAGNLSVGQAQLVAFARTMARDTPLVILDEATASVDSLTEVRVQRATDALLASRTVLVIAHRLSTIVGADLIAVMHEGRIVERGTHAQLLAQGGRYAELYARQFAEQGDAKP